MAAWYRMLASSFDGCGGYYGNLCDGGMYYAELGNADCGSGVHLPHGAMALQMFGGGELPGGFPVTISYNGRTVTATKRDIGCGNSAVAWNDPGQRKIDLHTELYQRLGFGVNLDYVMVSPQGNAGAAPSGVGQAVSTGFNSSDITHAIHDENWAGWIWNDWKTVYDQCVSGYYASATAWNDIGYIDKFIR